MGRFSLTTSSASSGTVQTEAEVHWAEHLTPEQSQALHDFRSLLLEKNALQDGRDDDITLLRFLRARAYDVHKACEMYEKCSAWRKEHKVDTILQNFEFKEADDVLKYYPTLTHREDRFGRPLHIEQLGRMNVDGLMKVTTLERMIDHHIHGWEVLTRERFAEASKRQGRPIFTTLSVLDLDGVSMRMFKEMTRTFIKMIASIDQDNYPEHLGQMFIVNTPYVFKGIWAVIKPWLDPRTQKKIQIFSTGHEKPLLQVVGAESLPFWLGGECRCADCQRLGSHKRHHE